MLKYAFYLKLFVLIKHLSSGGEWADLELKMGILFSQIYLTKKCIVAAVYGFEMKCHSVLFSILGLSLFQISLFMIFFSQSQWQYYLQTLYFPPKKASDLAKNWQKAQFECCMINSSVIDPQSLHMQEFSTSLLN